MSSYYYAAASLPMLSKHETPPMSGNDFLEFCRGTLSEKDYSIVAQADAFGDRKDDGIVQHDPALDAWNRFRNALNDELAFMRAEQMQKNTEMYAVTFRDVPEVMDISRRIIGAENPLEADSILYSALWNYVSELSTNHFFDRTMFICYFLRLQLQERAALKNEERGIEVYKNVFSNIKATG